MEVRVGPLDELPDGRGVRVEAGGHAVHALGDRCSHAKASLSEGEVFDLEVECPRHGSPFDLRSGEPSALPATVAVAVYPTRIDDGDVYLTIEEEGT
jgi:3-phenylpropionate/trans-cinnamate dioxygenase ferredoxin subunit